MGWTSGNVHNDELSVDGMGYHVFRQPHYNGEYRNTLKFIAH